jgi:hypothetical protein
MNKNQLFQIFHTDTISCFPVISATNRMLFKKIFLPGYLKGMLKSILKLNKHTVALIY